VAAAAPITDLRRTRPELYRAPDAPVRITVPPLTYLMVDGAGDPRSVPAYADAVAAPTIAALHAFIADAGLAQLGDAVVGRACKDPPHTHQSPPALAAFRPWGS